MGQIIKHACGHDQIHYISGFTSQQERKARWLQTTKCRNCFVATKQAEQTKVVTRNGAAISHLELPLLAGSERQVAWATAIRASRLAALVVRPVAGEGQCCEICIGVADAKWWIDHRDLTDVELFAEAERHALVVTVLVREGSNTGIPQVA